MMLENYVQEELDEVRKSDLREKGGTANRGGLWHTRPIGTKAMIIQNCVPKDLDENGGGGNLQRGGIGTKAKNIWFHARIDILSYFPIQPVCPLSVPIHPLWR